MKRIITCSSLFVWLVLPDDLTRWEKSALVISLVVFVLFIHRIGERIALLECICFIAALEILLVPSVTYWLVPATMPIESTRYFTYALPAYVAFYIGMMAINRHQPMRAHLAYIQAVTAYLQDKKTACIILLSIGLAGFGIKTLIPTAPTMFSTLPFYCLFISVFYAYYSGSSLRYFIIGLIVIVLATYTVREGMFGDLFFWVMQLTIFFTAGMPHQLSIRLKVVFIVFAFSFLLIIQSIKGEYRRNTWGYQRSERNSDAGLMGELIADRLANPEKMLNAEQFFSAFVRFNQGILIGSAMAKVPTHEPFANGEVLLSFVYPLVPRFLWSNKPQTGGYENIRRFTSLPQSENTSINLSPIGEGYVNFGYGGIVFALMYGLLLREIFQFLIHLSITTPSVLLWIPAIYSGCLTMETDILSTWGSMINCGIFVALLYGLLKRFTIQL